MATLDELLVRIDASTELLRRELAKGSGEVSKFERNTTGNLDKIDKRFSLLGRRIKTALAAFGVAFSVRGIVNFTRSAIAGADALGEAAQAAGTTAETLQELRFAFGQLAQTTDGQVDKALQDFNKNLGLTIQGTGRAIAQFESLGIVLKDSSGAGRNTSVVLEETLAALAAVENDAVRAATAARLFGDEAGPKLAAALGQGLSAVDALRAATPGLLSEENVQIASKLNDAFGSMAGTIGGALKNSIVSATGALADFFGLIERGPIIEAEQRIRSLERLIRDLEFVDSAGSLGGNRIVLDNARRELADLQAQQSINRLVRPFGDRRRIIAEGEQANIAAAQAAASAGLLPSAGGIRSARAVPLNTEFNEFLGRTRSARNVPLNTEMNDFLGRVRGASNVDVETEYTEFLKRVEAANRESLSKVEGQWGDFSATISSTLHSTLSRAFQGIGTDFKSLIKGMLADLAATGLLRALGGAIGGPAGAFLTGGLPGRAEGGPVTAGHGYVVGERRPEVFVPNMSGRILPSTGGGGVMVTQNLYFPTNLRDVRAEIAAAAPLIARATEAKIQESRVRGR